MAVTDIGWCRFWFDDDGRFHLQPETDQASGMVIEQAIGEARSFNNGRSDVTMSDAVLRSRSAPRRDRQPRPSQPVAINLHLRTDGRCTDSTGHFLPDAIRCHHLVTACSPPRSSTTDPVSVGR
jgi:hypothetical protein